MKKALTSRLSISKNLLRTVMQKPPKKEKQPSSPKNDEQCSRPEVESLQDQVESLKDTIRKLQEDSDLKDVAVANLAREKEKITSDFLKQKRANRHLKKQLEDERRFYYKEKESYCVEMTEYKKLKRSLSCSNVSDEEKRNIEEYKKEITNLKKTLSKTLIHNYNLSVKYLRMKNTKSFLQEELNRLRAKHEKIVKDLTSKLETMTNEVKDVLELKMNYTVSPSSKKYLELVKQNSSLVYENLCLQLDVDRLNLKFEKIKLYRTKSETNSRLKLLRSSNSVDSTDVCTKCHGQKKRTIKKRVRLDVPGDNSKIAASQEEVIKIFQCLENPTPSISNMSRKSRDDEKKEKKEKKKKQKRKKSTLNSKTENFSEAGSHPNKEEVYAEKQLVELDSKLDIANVSAILSPLSSDFQLCESTVVSIEVLGTQSAPELLKIPVCKENCDTSDEINGR